jgi:hypothetical protein
VEPTSKPIDDNVAMTPVSKPVSKADKAAAKAQAATDLKAQKAAATAAKAQARAKPAAPAQGNSGFFTPVPPPSNPEAQVVAQPATVAPPQMELQTNQQSVATTPSKAAATPAKKPAAKLVRLPPPANGNYAGKTLGLKPVEAPPLPVSAKTEAKLKALLARYMADQISPSEYQKERAAILAEP